MIRNLTLKMKGRVRCVRWAPLARTGSSLKQKIVKVLTVDFRLVEGIKMFRISRVKSHDNEGNLQIYLWKM